MNTKITSLILITALALSACSTATPTPAPAPPAAGPEAVVAEGHLVPRADLYLNFAIRGKVAEVLVAAGQTVSAGTVLARLADREPAEANVAAAQLELTNAQQAVDTLQRTAGLTHAQAQVTYIQAQAARATAERAWEALDTKALDDEIEVAEADVKTRKADLEDAQTEFDKYSDLDKNNATRVTAEDALTAAHETYNEALRQWEALTNRRANLQAALDAALAAEAEALRVVNDTAPEAVSEAMTLAQARLDAATAQLAAAQKALDNYELKAPFAGKVTDINVMAGESVGTEKWAFQLADFGAWYVETSDLTELEVVKIAEDQTVTLVPDALPDVQLTGTVESIGLASKLQSGDVLYTVKIKVDDVDARLRWGMTLEITFEP